MQTSSIVGREELTSSRPVKLNAELIKAIEHGDFILFLNAGGKS